MMNCLRTKQSHQYLRSICVFAWMTTLVVAPAHQSACGAPPVADSPEVDQPPPSEPPLLTSKLRVHATKVSKPVLRYRFTPRINDQQVGNAALHYMDAAVLMSELNGAKLEDELSDIGFDGRSWDEKSIQEAEKLLQKFAVVLEQVRRGAKQRDCSWEGTPTVHFESRPLGLHRYLRAIATLLAARIRVDLAKGDLDQAAENLCCALTFARHIANGPTLIHALVGIAINGILVHQLQELMQLPGCPNLYWSLTAIPSSVTNLAAALDSDEGEIYTAIPALRNLTSQQMSDAKWQKLLQSTIDRADDKFLRARAAGDKFIKDFPRTSDAMVARYEKQSVAFLKANGYSDSELESISGAQAVLLHSTIYWDNLRDDLIPLAALPYWQAHRSLDAIWKRLRDEVGSVPIPIGDAGIQASLMAQARNARYHAGLRTIEAMRDYAARHGGRLPKSLDDIKDLPLPIDPYTGKSFEYRLENGKAILDGLSPDGAKGGIHAMRWEIDLAVPAK